MNKTTKREQKSVQTDYVDDLRAIFKNSKHGLGSHGFFSELLDKYPQVKNNKIRYIIAGSWAIEFLTGQKLKHRDIDVIILQAPLWYLDNAITQEEKCDGVIPLDSAYFKCKNIVPCTNLRKNGIVYVPEINIQLCFKFIGELNPTLSKRAIVQLSLLYKYTIQNGLDQDKILLILKSCTPKSLNHKELTKQIGSSVTEYIKDKATWLKEIKKIHRTINKALHQAFNDKTIL